jgi:hypothetical protein
MISTSSDSDKAAANGNPAMEISIVNLQTKEPVLDLLGFGAADFAPLDPVDASSTHWFCAWAPQEDHLLLDVQNCSYTVGSSNALNWFNLKGINPRSSIDA